MTLLLCLALLIVALMCHWRGADRWAFGFTASTVALILLLGSGVVAKLLLPLTQMSNRLENVRWQDRNTLVLLGEGTYPADGRAGPSVPYPAYNRIVATAAAYRECRRQGKDCAVLVSGGDPLHHGASEASVYAAALVPLGVPAEAITLEDHSLTTWQNAQLSLPLIPADRQVVVVTSILHLQRSLLMFRHFRPDVTALPSDPFGIELTLLPTTPNFAHTDAIAHEFAGTAQFYIYTKLGLWR
jgi:uncharacterized SAM-binding protein YcdF (DUF218 family)